LPTAQQLVEEKRKVFKKENICYSAGKPSLKGFRKHIFHWQCL